MEVGELHAHCMAEPGAWSDNPWDQDHPVSKVGEPGSIFAFLGAATVGVTSATTREVADEWLDRYPDDASVMAHLGRSGQAAEEPSPRGVGGMR